MSRADRVVIFLDIDGVLLPVPRFTFGGGDLCAQSVRLLQQIVNGCGGAEKVTLILSSTWRNFPEQVRRLNAFVEKTVGGGVPAVAGGTPNGTPKTTVVTYYPDDASERRLVRDRVDEVTRWIHTHVREHPEAIGGRWFAIDDMQLDVDDRMRGHFLKTETETGLTEADVARALELIASFPTPEVAAQAAAAALVDPALKDDEIDILESRCRELSGTVSELQESLRQSRQALEALQSQRLEWERERKEMARRFEDVSFRLARYDFAKKNEALRTALAALESKTGKERHALESRIKVLVDLLRAKKALEKTARKRQKRPQ
ncbi:uncharacterized protein Tco025E_07588 [Trypanosoma conorhini]|uniref:Uncharacterized protein n=1 Tax=Trypanosoma conorhini TaxID=83891 RepID=A0A422NLL7_9TRYP|nr:uncharacterized protein Tco025E_07588 [Trypanosoma conorhini]RNF06353.1 hypothetical protein Tco025E_07588 [Trypanosoma conorhini]